MSYLLHGVPTSLMACASASLSFQTFPEQQMSTQLCLFVSPVVSASDPAQQATVDCEATMRLCSEEGQRMPKPLRHEETA
mmetsp:Transcript_74081/g.240876  ORF Transcript_74081/g.240876 Transcript_74081/m.240876 type:complete len:80 (+) Transcript_74081:310-549(+)